MIGPKPTAERAKSWSDKKAVTERGQQRGLRRQAVSARPGLAGVGPRRPTDGK